MKQRVIRTLRTVGLLPAAEKLRLIFSPGNQSRNNATFSEANPDYKLPPKELAYDAFSVRGWDFYNKTGIETATFLAQIARLYLPEGRPVRVLDWGCGPARVIRHVPEAFGANAEVYGSDYNADTIKWCAENIPGVHFSLNGLEPPLPFDSGFLDFIYSISVFTHLSEPVGRAWMQELSRITHSGSILVITTQGDTFLEKLMPDEVEAYRSEGVVVRGNVAEGSRIFSTFHSKEYLKGQLFKDFEVLECIEGTNLAQDRWVLRKS